jgi:hypothetical protein
MSVDIVALYGEGCSIPTVAEAAGLSYRRARDQLLAAGVTIRPCSTIREETLQLAEDAAELYGRRMTVRQVAGRMGLSYSYTHRLLRIAGVAMRDSHGRPRKAVA